jgi:hypothetical protein
MRPLEVSKRNRHQARAQKGRAQKRSSQPLEPLSHGGLVGSMSFQDSTLDDDDKHIEYASAKDELKAIAAKPEHPLRTAVLDWIEAVLTANGLS